jgi:N-methylhydantoinase B
MAIREFLARFDDVGEGDVFIINDPYLAAEHQNDVQFCAPFFHDGELISWIGCMAHQVDLGGTDAGSWCPTATEVYAEGLRIPPGRIVRRGATNRELWDIVIANSRMPFTVSNDFTAFLAGLKVAAERMTELCRRYGGETVKAVMGQAIETSEQGLRDLLRTLPDGTFEHESYLDRPADHGSELVKVHCRMTKTDDRLVFDYNGSDQQSPAYGMATRAGTVGAVATLMLCLFGSRVPWNHGLMRPVEVVAEDGLCVTAVEPAPVSGGAAGANWVAMNAAAGCIAKMVSFSDEHRDLAFGPGDGSWQLAQFGGLNQYGEPFAAMYLDSLLWGGPAFIDRDGVDSGGAMVILGGGTEDVEQQEVGQPLLYLWRREVPDSGGAGRHRGGVGIEFAMTPIDTDSVSGVIATHGVALPNRTGIFGGYPGSCAQFELVRGGDVLAQMGAGQAIERLQDADGSYSVLPSVSAGAVIKRGEVVNVRLQNGGGYGDPIEREPAAVERDVANGAVSAERAERVYGVAVGDQAATERRRAEIRDERRARMAPPRGAGGEAAFGGGSTGGVGGASTGRGSAVPDGVSGDALSVSSGVASCARCGEELGPIGSDWRGLTGTVELGPDDLGPLIEVHPDLVAEQSVCPHCAASLWVEILPREGERWSDFAL